MSPHRSPREEMVDAIILFMLLIGGALFALAWCLGAIGCSRAPTAVSAVRIAVDPWDGANLAVYEPAGGGPGAALFVWRSGRVNLITVVRASCGGTPTRAWAPLDVPVAFGGVAEGPPAPGDTLGGPVLAGTVADSLAVTGGRFRLACVAPDLLEGHAWITLGPGSRCGPDSLVVFLRLVRREPGPAPELEPYEPAWKSFVTGRSEDRAHGTGLAALAPRGNPGRPTLAAAPRGG